MYPPYTAFGASALANELQVLARCDHKNIVRLLGAGLSSPTPFLVMEYMPYSLHDVVYDTTVPLPLDKVLRIGSQMAQGLAVREMGRLGRWGVSKRAGPWAC